MYEEHKYCKSPKDPAIKIWRFMDFTKFVSLLETKALFFTNISTLKDPLEGFLSRPTVEQFKTVPENLPEEGIEKHSKIIQHNLGVMRYGRELLYVCSWHMNEYESAAMWQLYLKSNEGVAIQSNFNRLKVCFRDTSEVISVGVVNYIDYDFERISSLNMLDIALHKRKSYEHERELRAIVMPFKKYDLGMFVSVDIDTLIDRIYVAPSSPAWFLDLVNSMVKRYKLSKEVSRSSLTEGPLY